MRWSGRKSGGKPAFPTYEVMGVERFKFQSSRLLISLVGKAGLPPLFLILFCNLVLEFERIRSLTCSIIGWARLKSSPQRRRVFRRRNAEASAAFNPLRSLRKSLCASVVNPISIFHSNRFVTAPGRFVISLSLLSRNSCVRASLEA